LLTQYGDSTIDLAERLTEWETKSKALANSPVEISDLISLYSEQSREQLRRIYLDLPDISWVLLLLAWHDARMIGQPPPPKEVAAQTEGGFLTLAYMAGMWGLRRRWHEQSLSVLQSEKYANLRKVLEEVEGDRGVLRDEVAGAAERRERSADRELRPLSKLIGRKSGVFKFLKDSLNEELSRRGFEPPPTVEQVPPLPGNTLLRLGDLRLGEESVKLLRVRILCLSEDDCYRALGVVHTMGSPTTSRHASRFRDYIATPQANGYRALHTAIQYKYQQGAESRILVEFRILTQQMHRLNECGVVAALESPELIEGLPVWWESAGLDMPTAYQRKEHSTLRQLLEAHPVESRSDPIYVFTPRGKVIYLDRGSTPLDFAYAIHTFIGDHATRLEVNRQVVRFDHELRNGDIVRVRYDERSSGPDPDWLGYVKTKHAQQSIKRALINASEGRHRGRATLEFALLKTRDEYATRKFYNLSISGGRIDAFVHQMTSVLNLSSGEELYDRIVSTPALMEKLTSLFVSRELSIALLDAAGANLPYSWDRILFCGECRPVPGNKVVAFETADAAGKVLAVHTGDCPKGKKMSPSSQASCRWSSVPETEGLSVAMTIYAGDRYRIVADILDVVYNISRSYLYKLEAQSGGDNRASIKLVMKVSSHRELTNIQDRLEQVPNVSQVFCYPVSRVESYEYTSQSIHDEENPYGFQEVWKAGKFINRESQVDQLTQWLSGGRPTEWMVLHGQKRVGKSSLAKYLIHEHLAKKAVGRLLTPVYIDFQGLSPWSAQSLAETILPEVYRVLGRPLPEQAGRGPMVWLNHGLRAATENPGRRMLMVIDEFSWLLDNRKHPDFDPRLFANLRQLMSEHRDINWLLIVADSNYFDRDSWGEAGDILSRAKNLPLQHLAHNWAERLILDRAKQVGLDYDKDVPSQIIDLTSGNPYFINVLCYYMVNQARLHRRHKISAEDLDHAQTLMVAEGRKWFAHYLDKLGDREMSILSAVVSAPRREEDWVSYQAVAGATAGPDSAASTVAFDREINGMIRLGVLEKEAADGEVRIKIAIKLFHKFVARIVPPVWAQSVSPTPRPEAAAHAASQTKSKSR
jgi:(p)ppGpp synthase/HD superfamily hydrolase